MIGDSILHWAGQRAFDRGLPNLKLPENMTIGWHCVRGMKWADFHHIVQREALFNGKQPRFILLHLGGNDLESTSLYKLRRVINREIKYLRSLFSDTMIIWCDILQRRVWRGVGERINQIMERKRKRVNGFGRNVVMSSGGRGKCFSVEIDFSTAGFYRNDGVHLSDVGLDMLLFEIRELLLSSLDK